MRQTDPSTIVGDLGQAQEKELFSFTREKEIGLEAFADREHQIGVTRPIKVVLDRADDAQKILDYGLPLRRGTLWGFREMPYEWERPVAVSSSSRLPFFAPTYPLPR